MGLAWRPGARFSVRAHRLSSAIPIAALRSASAVVLGLTAVATLPAALAEVPLMAGQRARPLNGTFNQVPVLHSNQPEEVEGPGILISTAPGVSYAAENGMALRNAEYTFNGEFGVHMHHKYFPTYRNQIRAGERRTELTLGLILINPGRAPVSIRFERGAVRNSFEAPYLANNLLGVKPLGRRPWNTGPGDATAVQMLREQLDRNLSETVVIPPRSRIVLFRTQLPALGIANGLLRGRSNGPFQMAVVAASSPGTDADLIAELDRRRLAPGRIYLRRLADIESRRVFSRVGGVAIGDTYTASLQHDLKSQGPLHVPFTSTTRHHFGTRDVQVNPLASRMIDSSLDNVGTYGVRFDVDLKLKGSGPYELVLSHPPLAGSPRPFVAFRGSLQVRTEEGLQEMHLGMRSGESHALTTINLKPGVANPVRVSLVYPADATPGHLLSVVPASQLAVVQARQAQQTAAASPADQPVQPPVRPATPNPLLAPRPLAPRTQVARPPSSASQIGGEGAIKPPPSLPHQQPIQDRYREALEAQQEIIRGLMGR